MMHPVVVLFIYAFVQLFGMWFCLVWDVTSFGAYLSGRFELAYAKDVILPPGNIITTFYLLVDLDNGDVAHSINPDICS